MLSNRTENEQPTKQELSKSHLSKFRKQARHCSDETLRKHQKNIELLAQSIDPFRPDWDPTINNLLHYYNLLPFSDDPFELTKVILQMLDILQTRAEQSLQ